MIYLLHSSDSFYFLYFLLLRVCFDSINVCISVKQINATCYGDSVKWDDAVEWGVVVKEVAAVVFLLLKRG